MANIRFHGVKPKSINFQLFSFRYQRSSLWVIIWLFSWAFWLVIIYGAGPIFRWYEASYWGNYQYRAEKALWGGNRARAIMEYQQAIARGVSEISVFCQLGDCFLKEGNYQEAEYYYRQGAKKYLNHFVYREYGPLWCEESSKVHLRLAECLIKLGRKYEAVEQMVYVNDLWLEGKEEVEKLWNRFPEVKEELYDWYLKRLDGRGWETIPDDAIRLTFKSAGSGRVDCFTDGRVYLYSNKPEVVADFPFGKAHIAEIYLQGKGIKVARTYPMLNLKLGAVEAMVYLNFSQPYILKLPLNISSEISSLVLAFLNDGGITKLKADRNAYLQGVFIKGIK